MIVSHYGSWRHTSSNELQSLQYPGLILSPSQTVCYAEFRLHIFRYLQILTSHTLLTAGYLVYVPNFNDVRGFSCICVMVTARFAARLWTLQVSANPNLPTKEHKPARESGQLEPLATGAVAASAIINMLHLS